MDVTPAVFAEVAHKAQQVARDRGDPVPAFRSGPRRCLRRYPSGTVVVVLPIAGTRAELWRAMCDGLTAAARPLEKTC